MERFIGVNLHKRSFTVCYLEKTGEYRFGKTPMRTFLDSVSLAREKLLDSTKQTEEEVTRLSD